MPHNLYGYTAPGSMTVRGKCGTWRITPIRIFCLILVSVFVWYQLSVVFLWNAKLSMRQILFPGHQDQHNTTHVLLLTQMRSGSSFTGHLLVAAPSTFYTEEPVREYFRTSLLEPHQTTTAVTLLRDIFLCRFSARKDYYERRLTGLHHHNPDTVRLCFESNYLCWDPATNEVLCRAARVHVARVVVLDLKAVTPLLRDPDLNTHVIHLVRDPRATLTSREALKKYFGQETRNITSLCGRYRRDLQAALTLKKKFPDR